MGAGAVQYLIEPFTFLGFEGQNWMLIVVGLIAAFVLFVWRTRGPTDGAASRVASRHAMKKLLCVPFGPGTAHVVLFRMIFPDRAVPGRAQKRQERADGAAENSGQNGRYKRKLTHVTLQTTSETRAKRRRGATPTSIAQINPRKGRSSCEPSGG